MTPSQIVFVVMGNDFPDAVFGTKELAEAYCDLMRADAAEGHRKIYWRVYEFEVRS